MATYKAEPIISVTGLNFSYILYMAVHCTANE
jgi:hypothetical protein